PILAVLAKDNNRGAAEDREKDCGAGGVIILDDGGGGRVDRDAEKEAVTRSAITITLPYLMDVLPLN
ncbi:hypothetical protein A2U01_0117255, partial [Trifolium medium]|nr:hypothetical protein [Trifolium medium]